MLLQQIPTHERRREAGREARGPVDRLAEKGRQALALSRRTIAQHLEGKITIGLYAINPRAQCCKWVAIELTMRTPWSI